MSKLLKVRSWLSVSESARHLSGLLEVPVSEQEVYRLALEGALTLSVRFPQEIEARPLVAPNRVVTLDDVRRRDDDQIVLVKGEGYALGETEFLDGLFDLSMLGGEKSVVRQLEWNPDLAPSRVEADYLIFRHHTDSRAPSDVLYIPAERRGEEFNYGMGNSFYFDNYSMWTKFPEQVQFVVRSAALAAFQSAITKNKLGDEDGIGSRERTSLLNIIGVLLELVQNPRPGRAKQAAVIAEMLENYSDKPGISKSNLDKQFAEAKRSLSDG